MISSSPTHAPTRECRSIVIVSPKGFLRHSFQNLIGSSFEDVRTFQTFDQVKAEFPRVEACHVALVEAEAGRAGEQVADIVAHSSLWRIVLFFASLAGEEIGSLVRAGARGAITDDTHPDSVPSILQLVGDGHLVWPAAANAGEGFNRRASDEPGLLHRRMPTDFHTRLALLSKRENEVVDLIAQGLGNKRIASALSISDTTVRLHMRSIMRKLGAENRTQVALFSRARR